MAEHLRNPRLLATYAVGFCVFFTLLTTFTYVNFYLAAPPFRLNTAALGWLFALTAAFLGGAAGICLTLVRSLPVVMLGLALCCTGVFVAQSAASSYIGAAASQARAAAVGLYVMFYYIGGSLGATLAGPLWSRGGWPACVALIACAQALTIALALCFWPPGTTRDGAGEPPIAV
jgi:predicted MFS family arabinose efflux permease